MLKRSLIAVAALAVVIYGLVFYAKGQRSHTLIQRTASTKIQAKAEIPEKAVKAAKNPRATPVAQGDYSKERYLSLRRRYKPLQPQADGALSGSRLEQFAKSTRTLIVPGRHLWPAVKDVIYGNLPALKNRLAIGLNPDATVYMSYPFRRPVSLLDLAISAGQRGSIKALLNHDASVDPIFTVTHNGMRLMSEAPLPLAAQYGEDDVVRALLQRGANVNQRLGLPANDATALKAAVYSGNVSTVYLLLTNGADINSLGPGATVPEILFKYKVTPRDVTMRNLLIKYGANLPSGQPP